MKTFTLMLAGLFVTVAFAAEPERRCPNELVAMADIAYDVAITGNFDLDQERERVKIPFRLIAEDTHLIAPTIVWEDSALGIPGDRNRSGGVLAINTVTMEQSAHGTSQSAAHGILTSPANSLVIGLNWHAGPWTIIDLSNNQFEQRAVITPDQSHRGNDYIPERPLTVRGMSDLLRPERAMMGPTVSMSAHFSPDGTKFLSNYPDGDAFVFDSRNGKQLFRIQLDLTLPPGAIDFSARQAIDGQFTPDGKYIVTVHQWGAGAVWDAENGKPICSFAIPRSQFHRIPTIEMSPFSNVFAVRTSGKVERKHLLTSLEFYKIIPGGGRVLESRLPKVERMANFSFLKRNAGEDEEIGLPTFRFTPDDKLLMASQVGDQINRYDLVKNPNVDTPEVLFEAGHRGDKVNHLAVARDNSYYASGSENGILSIWSPGANGKHYQIDGNTWPIRRLDFTKDGRFLFVQVADPSDEHNGYPLATTSKIYRVDLSKLP